MRTIMHIHHKRKRRGIGNVIASMVFIFLLIFMTGNLMVWSILQFSDYQTIVQDMNSYDLLSHGEEISISGARLNSSNNLVLTVSNTGRSTAHIVSLWIINESSSDPLEKHYHYTQNAFVNSGQSNSGIGSSIKLDSTKKYTFRVITELGNMASYQIIPLSEAILMVTTGIDPITVISEHDINVQMIVYNNLSITGAVYDLQPQTLSYTVLNLSATVNCGLPTPSTIDSLPAGSTAIFDWTCTIDGDAGAGIQFNTTYVNAPQYVWDTEIMLIVTGGGRSNSTSYSAVAGDIFMDFKSIEWAERSPRQDTGPFITWNTDWNLDKSDYLVFRMNFTNMGNNNITLAKETAIFFQALDSSQYYEFFIVNVTGGIISTYIDGDIIISPDETVTLFFAVSTGGADPTVGGNSVKITNGGTYTAIIALFGITPNYGQAIPFQAFIVV